MARRPALVVGALGRMGERVRAALHDHPALRLGAALEVSGHARLGEELAPGVALTDDAKAALAASSVAIDFSTPASTAELLRAAAEAGVAFVTGTTGLGEAEQARVRAAAERIAIVQAPNFSISVNVLTWLVGEAARRLGPAYDAELFELHHAAKRDAPSGTALHLARAIAEARGQALEEKLVLSREGEIGARPEGAIGVQTLRGGDCPGEHTVLFVGRGERLELAHRAATRDHFARGAVEAAAWVLERPPGLYSMRDVLGL